MSTAFLYNDPSARARALLSTVELSGNRPIMKQLIGVVHRLSVSGEKSDRHRQRNP